MLFIFLMASNHHCLAGVTTDGSQGPQTTLNGPDYDITDNLGQTRGSNLFHSFSEFDLRAGESAVFSGPASIENIIGRVTGGDASMIDGTIRSNIAGANLFLLNPAGILFGPNAALDISGSFYAGTADYLRFDDGAVFQADPARSSVLSVAQPQSFGFLSANPAGITLDDAQLEVPSGETLSLVGGDIDITGTTRKASLLAPGGEIDLVGVGVIGEVNLDDPQLLSTEGAKSGDIHLSNARISTKGEAAERVVIKGGRIQIENGSTVRSENSKAVDAVEPGLDIEAASQIEISGGSGLYSNSLGAGKGGDLRIKAKELVLKDDMSLIWSQAYGEGDGGDIRIDVDVLTLDQGNIESVASSTGNGGAIRINAADSIVVKGAGGETEHGYGITSWGTGQGLGRPGEITITTGLLDLRNWGNISMISTGLSNLITIEAEKIHLDNSSISVTGLFGEEIGDISIHANTFEAFNNSIVGAGTSDSADAGMINLTADSILLDGSYISSGTLQLSDTSNPGNGGNIRIEADQLTLQNHGRIYVSSTIGAGDAGSIVIDVADTLSLSDDSDISTEAYGMGNAGDIDISAHSIRLDGNSDISASTRGPGQGGNIFIQARALGLHGESAISSISNGSGNAGSIKIGCDGNIHLDDGRVFAASLKDGKGGDIQITAENLHLSNNAMITAGNFGTADAGNIAIDVKGDVTVDGSRINTESKQADGGDIRIKSGHLIHINDSKVKANIGGGAETTGGNIRLQSRNVVLNQSQVMADALQGQGGNIDIFADTYLADPTSVVDASSSLGIDGVVDIRAPLRNLSGSLKPLSHEFLNAADLLKAPCEARVMGGDYGSFIVKGLDALPMEPGSLQISPP